MHRASGGGLRRSGLAAPMRGSPTPACPTPKPSCAAHWTTHAGRRSMKATTGSGAKSAIGSFAAHCTVERIRLILSLTAPSGARVLWLMLDTQSNGASGPLLPRTNLPHLPSSKLLQLMKKLLLLAILPASALLAQTPDPATELIRLADRFEGIASTVIMNGAVIGSASFMRECESHARAMRLAADMVKDVAAKFPPAPVVIVPQSPAPPRTTPLVPVTKPPVQIGPNPPTRPTAAKRPKRLSMFFRR